MENAETYKCSKCGKDIPVGVPIKKFLEQHRKEDKWCRCEPEPEQERKTKHSKTEIARGTLAYTFYTLAMPFTLAGAGLEWIGEKLDGD